MKLKYYMRGLGIGILLATLILSISNTKENLTDAEIIARAEKLGMVMEDEIDNNLKEVIKKPSITQEPEATPDISITPAPTPAISVTPALTVTPIVTLEPTVTSAPSVTEQPEVAKLVTFEIQKGMSSNKVSKLLQEIGLIEDAKDFNEYLIDENKVSVIQVGTYELPENCTYDDIVNAITKKN
ncbi:MAG: hypothetical protein QM644_05030 [Mobilitalea sp.]